MFRNFISRLQATFRPEQYECRLQEEIETHLDELTEHESRRQTNEPEARLAARRAFGPIETIKEQYRDQARFRPLENLLRDVRFALRQCRKNLTFTIAAVLSLALGIGANAALFSFANALLLKHLPVPQSERLSVLSSDDGSVTFSPEELDELNRHSSPRIGTLLGSYPLDVSFSLGDQPEWISAELVTGSYFHTLGIQAEQGRLLAQRDLDAAAGSPVCVISDQFWHQKFDSRPGIVGRTILINTRPYKIIGVTASGFRGTDLLRPSDIQLPATRLPDYMPSFVSDPAYDWHSRLYFLSAILRLNPTVTRIEAETELGRMHREYVTRHKRERSRTFHLVPGSDGFKSHTSLARPVSILLGVSLVVLLIACANLATLLLSRTSARIHEFTVRLAIGGSPIRIFAQVLIESMVLALFGTIAAIGVADVIAQALLAFLNRTTPAIHQLHIAIDMHVLTFIALVTVLSVLLFGTAPAWQAARAPSAISFSAGNTRAGAGLRKTFVAAQIALSFLVVLSAGLLAQTLRHLATLDLGYVPDEIATIDIRPASGGYTGQRANRFYQQALERLRTTPGVKAAAVALGVHLEGGAKMPIEERSGTTKYQANVFAVGAGYFETFGAHLIAGRDFNAADTPRKPQVYVISEHLAQTYFHGQQAVGNYLLMHGDQLPVVGVVSNIRDQNLRDASLDTVYQDVDQLLTSSLSIYIHCDGSCRSLMPALRKVIRDWDPNTPILSLTTIKTQMQSTFSTEQALGLLSMLFGLLALILVATGLYGVLSYMLTRRTREIGIRTAIGALPSDIVRLFAAEALMMLGMGTLIGVPSSWAAVNLLRSQLFGVAPHDPAALLICFGCIATTVILASIAPLRRSLRIAPQQALRVD